MENGVQVKLVPTNELLDSYAYLSAEWQEGDQTQELTLTLLKEGHLGKRIQHICVQLDRCMLLLAQASSCFWGCNGGDHTANNFIRRIYNYSLTTLRLACLGMYDEALGTLRSASEAITLLELFCLDAQEFERWKVSTGEERRTIFAPYQVRKRIRSVSKGITADDQTYWTLCDMGTHVTPSSAFSSHRFDGKTHVGGAFSEAGFLLVLNELAITFASSLFFAGLLLKPGADNEEEMKSAGESLRNCASDELRATTYENWLGRDKAK